MEEEEVKIEKEMVKDYLAAAAEVIGERTPQETAYDDAVVEGMNQGLAVPQALTRAGAMHPSEALQVAEEQMPYIAARYEYLREHDKLMRLIRKRKLR